jgi:hypothetical protein
MAAFALSGLSSLPETTGEAMKRVWLGLLLGLGAAPAWAEMPNYDVDAYCQRLGQMAGGSEQLRKTCVEQEQRAYDQMKPKWDAIPAVTRTYCERLGRMAGGSFELLDTCVDQELQAGKANTETKFKR